MATGRSSAVIPVGARRVLEAGRDGVGVAHARGSAVPPELCRRMAVRRSSTSISWSGRTRSQSEHQRAAEPVGVVVAAVERSPDPPRRLDIGTTKRAGLRSLVTRPRAKLKIGRNTRSSATRKVQPTPPLSVPRSPT